MLFQSSTVLFLSKHAAHIQRGKNEASASLSFGVASMEHQRYVDMNKLGESFSTLK